MRCLLNAELESLLDTDADTSALNYFQLGKKRNITSSRRY